MDSLSIRQVSTHLEDVDAAFAALRAGLTQPRMSVVVLFCSPTYDLARLGALLEGAFGCPVVACTSSGQIGEGGFERGGLTGLSLASPELSVKVHFISPLSASQEQAAEVEARVRAALAAAAPGRRAFGLVLVDGLALAEEGLVAALYQSLGNVPLVGGSAGDDLRFEQTAVYWKGRFHPDAAVLAIFETTLPFTTFKLQHFTPTDRKLVITRADPARRIVYEINGFPAVDAYAEALGLKDGEVDTTVFSQHPVMLRIGTDTFVRSMGKVGQDGSLTFFCAIEEGLVLSIGEGEAPLEALERGFEAAAAQLGGEPALVLGCDCILRRLEFEKRELDGEVGRLYARHRVFGFSTYGEQFNAVHVNQTLVGVALGSRS
jgi:hypothetical protein